VLPNQLLILSGKLILICFKKSLEENLTINLWIYLVKIKLQTELMVLIC